jgi:hypothetical protein
MTSRMKNFQTSIRGFILVSPKEIQKMVGVAGVIKILGLLVHC